MEEAALQNVMNSLAVEDEGSLMWREGLSYMAVFRDFELEVEALVEEGEKLKNEIHQVSSWSMYMLSAH